MRAALAGICAGAALLAAPAYVAAGELPAAHDELLVGQRDGAEQVLEVPDGVSWSDAAGVLRSNPGVTYVNRNWIARGAWVPNDVGVTGAEGGWAETQWNFIDGPADGGGTGVNGAWSVLRRHPSAAGGKGVKIAIVDSGVAYRNKGKRFRRSPDLTKARFTAGRDFVGHDKVPLDLNGHGTHVASTIGEQTNNQIGLTGIAYKAKLMPVRVLNAHLVGRASDVAKGIRWAAKHGADVINLSLQFPTCATGQTRGDCVSDCTDLRSVCKAIGYAIRSGALIVAAAGNHPYSGGTVTFPAAVAKAGVLAVGATTSAGALAGYSATGAHLDLVAPGGELRGISCVTKTGGDGIVQMSFRVKRPKSFCLQRRAGTSMAAAHAAGIAALVIASGVLPASARPKAIENQLRRSAYNPSGQPGIGAGRIDALAAVSADYTG